ncbi:peptidylprolyl isomerase [Sphingomonas antarctica]|uniref:peptidylprolyl isomerase n=1 Tax=Sphingomonas antarctica TaxID=2040274 RepID=UPI0039E9997B
MFTFALFAFAQAAAAQAAGRVAPDPRAPSEIVAAASAGDWVAIAPRDLLVMDLPPLNGKARRVIIQLIPAPFSQGWVGNIRKLAAAHWWDGTAVTRVQDNYVAQWGDPGGDTPKAKPLPVGLVKVPESEYTVDGNAHWNEIARLSHVGMAGMAHAGTGPQVGASDAYAVDSFNFNGWPTATNEVRLWPVHCYGMVGVGRNLSPDTGSGAELYTVIGHAPRHLDRNIALVGRVISGIENLSSLPRGTAALGVYATAAEHTPITSIRLGNEVADLPRFQYLSTESATFARYADARANRKDDFFIVPAGGADICNIPVPVRVAK